MHNSFMHVNYTNTHVYINKKKEISQKKIYMLSGHLNPNQTTY